MFSEWLDQTADQQIKANKIRRIGPHPDEIKDAEDAEDGEREEDINENDDELLNEFDEDD